MEYGFLNARIVDVSRGGEAESLNNIDEHISNERGIKYEDNILELTFIPNFNYVFFDIYINNKTKSEMTINFYDVMYSALKKKTNHVLLENVGLRYKEDYKDKNLVRKIKQKSDTTFTVIPFTNVSLSGYGKRKDPKFKRVRKNLETNGSFPESVCDRRKEVRGTFSCKSGLKMRHMLTNSICGTPIDNREIIGCKFRFFVPLEIGGRLAKYNFTLKMDSTKVD
ncbi:MAG: hypothetical protein ABEI13_00510 [Candidatus Paceibacteria bacterium]